MIEYRQSEIFIMIPMIMIIKSCEGDDKGICEIFLPDLKEEEGRIGILFYQVSQLLFEQNAIFNSKQDADPKNRSGSLSRSLKVSRKTPAGSPERKMENRSYYGLTSSPLGGNGHQKYKTILGNKSEYTTYSKPSREDNIKEKDKVGTKRLNFTFYNLLEKLILDIELTDKEKPLYDLHTENLKSCIVKIRNLAFELERNDPAEWNTFLDVALES